MTPGRYVGVQEEKEDKEDFEEKMKRLIEELTQKTEEGGKIDKEIKKNLAGIGWKV